MTINMASSAYALPSTFVSLEEVLSAERSRIQAATAFLSDHLRGRVYENLGIERIPVCVREQPYDLVIRAATQAIEAAGVRSSDIDVILDFVTFPGREGPYSSFAHRLSRDLGAGNSLNMSYRVGGCAGFHLAIRNAAALLCSDPAAHIALLVTADSPPAGSRTLLPISVQGDAGSAVVLRKDCSGGPDILCNRIYTLSHLQDIISIGKEGGPAGEFVINVDAERIEKELMPIYYLNFFRLMNAALAQSGKRLNEMDHFIYSSISRADYQGFIRALHLPEDRVAPARFRDLGHTFASDLVINYTDLCRNHQVDSGQYLCFASAGIGFTWGITIARA